MHLSRRALLGLVPSAFTGHVLTGSARSLRSLAVGEDRDDAVLPAVLDLVPTTTRKRDGQDGIVVELTDIARELDHTGTARPASLAEDDPDRAAFLDHLTVVSSTGGTVVQFALVPEWRALHGFDILDVDQIAVYGMPPDRVTILAGRFDPEGSGRRWRTRATRRSTSMGSW